MKEQIIESLKKVIYPNFEKDIISFGFLKDIKVNNDHLNLKIAIPSSNKEVEKELSDKIKDALEHFALKIELEIITPPPVQSSSPKTETKNIAPNIKNFVMISSGKGGVGKSTTSVNLAISFAKSGKSVGLLDADIYGPNIPRMLGLDGEKPSVTGDGKKLNPLQNYGIKMISMGVLYEKDQSLIWRGPMIMRAIEQLLADVNWGELDILVIDMPPGTGDAQLTLAQSVPVGAGINVTTPQMVAIDDGVRSLDMFAKLNIPIAGIIENMSGFTCPKTNETYHIFGQGNASSLASMYGTEVLAKIPLEPSIVESSDSGKPISFLNPDSNVSKLYMQIAFKIINFLDNVKADNKEIQPK